MSSQKRVVAALTIAVDAQSGLRERRSGGIHGCTNVISLVRRPNVVDYKPPVGGHLNSTVRRHAPREVREMLQHKIRDIETRKVSELNWDNHSTDAYLIAFLGPEHAWRGLADCCALEHRGSSSVQPQISRCFRELWWRVDLQASRSLDASSRVLGLADVFAFVADLDTAMCTYTGVTSRCNRTDRSASHGCP